jgi:mitogen-activated protein kinase 15
MSTLPKEVIEYLDRQVLRRYEVIQKIGKGAYGVVWKSIDKQTQQVVALKKAYGAFGVALDAKRTYREITLLRQLRGHPNIVQLLAVHRAENEQDLYMVFEILEADCNAVVRAGILTDVHHRYIFWQMLCALKYLHSAGVVHRDLKPANLLINSDASIKICDFGLARAIDEELEPEDLTDYVATRWYRAPEILCSSTKYTAAVDIWAAGCILAELIRGRALFPGQSEHDQLELIVSFTGQPSQSDLDSMESNFAQSTLSRLSYVKPKMVLESKLPGAPPEAIDLIKRLLRFNPAERPTAEECLNHPYLAQWHSPAKELTAPSRVAIVLKDSDKHTVKDYRAQIYREAVTPSDMGNKRTRNIRTSHMGR